MDNYKVVSRKLDWTREHRVYVNGFWVCTMVESSGIFAMLEATQSSFNRPPCIVETLRLWLHLSKIKGT